jgi:hypothetical protein
MLEGFWRITMNVNIAIISFVFSGLAVIFAVYPSYKGVSHWKNTLPLVFGTLLLGCGLDISKVPMHNILPWCVAYLSLIFIGKWLMRTAAEEYLRVHASEYVFNNR